MVLYLLGPAGAMRPDAQLRWEGKHNVVLPGCISIKLQEPSLVTICIHIHACLLGEILPSSPVFVSGKRCPVILNS